MLTVQQPKDLGEMIYIFVGEEEKFVLPFKGSESEMLQYWDLLAERGVRIKEIHHILVETIDKNPYTPLL